MTEMTRAARLSELQVPTVDEYVAALRGIKKTITDKQRAMLLFHHRAPGHVVSATVLAHEVEFESYEGANLQYGLLGSAILEQLGLALPDTVKVGILCEFVNPRFAANQEWLWVMRPHLAEALEKAGWAPRTSHLLYPEEALEE